MNNYNDQVSSIALHKSRCKNCNTVADLYVLKMKVKDISYKYKEIIDKRESEAVADSWKFVKYPKLFKLKYNYKLNINKSVFYSKDVFNKNTFEYQFTDLLYCSCNQTYWKFNQSKAILNHYIYQKKVKYDLYKRL